MKLHSTPSHKRAQQGLSLVELMIAIVIGLLITTALITLFLNMSRTNREMAKTNAQIENGRFALQILQNDIVHGGYWSGFVPQFEDLTLSIGTAPGDAPSQKLPLNTSPSPCTALSNWDAADGSSDGNNTAYKTKLIGIPVQTYDSVPTGCSTVITNKRNNTDILFVRHASTCVAGSSDCEADIANKLYFQLSQCETEISAGNLYVMDQTGFTLHNRNCTTTASKRRYVSRIYYVRNCATVNVDGTCADTIPTLVRSDFDYNATTNDVEYGTPQALISGIESFRAELGVDNVSDAGIDIISTTSASFKYTTSIKWADEDNLTSPRNRGDGSPDQYVRCGSSGCTIDQLSNTVAVKLYVLANAQEATRGYTDEKTYSLGTASTMCRVGSGDAGCALKVLDSTVKHHVFSTSVRLQNISSRRETP